MIQLCVAKIGKNTFAVTTTDMKDKLEGKHLQDQQRESMEAQMRHYGTQLGAQPEAILRAQPSRYYSGNIFGNPLRSRLF